MYPQQYDMYVLKFVYTKSSATISCFIGFCFGGMLASYITTKLWKYPSLGWKHLQESLVCITFAQPLLPVPELGSFVRDFPEIAKSIHSIHYEQDKIPLVISLLDQKNSCLLVRESSSEPGLHMSVHEEPRTVSCPWMLT